MTLKECSQAKTYWDNVGLQEKCVKLYATLQGLVTLAKAKSVDVEDWIEELKQAEKTLAEEKP